MNGDAGGGDDGDDGGDGGVVGCLKRDELGRPDAIGVVGVVGVGVGVLGEDQPSIICCEACRSALAFLAATLRHKFRHAS